MNYALCRCDHLANRLNYLQGTRLRLHSMFDTSANFIAADDHIVTFLAAQTPMAVCSIRLPFASMRSFFGNEGELLIQDTELLGRWVEISLKNALAFDPIIRSPISTMNQSMLLSQIKDSLLAWIPERGIYHEVAQNQNLGLNVIGSTPIGGKFATRFETLIDVLFSPEWTTDATETVRNIIGYGIGLTPSADDFLNGVLAACSDRSEWHIPLAAACRENLSRTTTISADMLYHGSEKRFSQTILDLFSDSDPQKAIDVLLKHGHSSGHDTLCGIYVGLMAHSSSKQRFELT